MPCGAALSAATARDAVGRPRDEGDGGAAAMQLADQREPESGRAAGDGDAASEQM